MMKRLNQPLRLLLMLLIVAFATTSCVDDSNRKVVLKLAHGLSTTHPVHFGMERMNEELIRLSGGTMSMDIYPSAQLGSEIQCIELLQIGSIDIAKVSAAPLEGFVDAFKLFGIPYLFRSREHFDKALNGEVGEYLLTSTEPYLFRGLTYFDSGARSIYTTKEPVYTPSDLSGLKIRVQQSPIAMEMVSVFGGSATPVDWGELYTALQSNVVDGAENNTPSITTAFHHEVSKYFTVTEHNFSPDVIIISTKRWNKFTDQQKRWMREAAEVGRAYETKLWKEQEMVSLELMKERGMEIIYPDKSLFIEAAQPMIRKYAEDDRFKSLIEKIDAIK